MGGTAGAGCQDWAQGKCIQKPKKINIRSQRIPATSCVQERSRHGSPSAFNLITTTGSSKEDVEARFRKAQDGFFVSSPMWRSKSISLWAERRGIRISIIHLLTGNQKEINFTKGQWQKTWIIQRPFHTFCRLNSAKADTLSAKTSEPVHISSCSFKGTPNLRWCPLEKNLYTAPVSRVILTNYISIEIDSAFLPLIISKMTNKNDIFNVSFALLVYKPNYTAGIVLSKRFLLRICVWFFLEGKLVFWPCLFLAPLMSC